MVIVGLVGLVALLVLAAVLPRRRRSDVEHDALEMHAFNPEDDDDDGFWGSTAQGREHIADGATELANPSLEAPPGFRWWEPRRRSATPAQSRRFAQEAELRRSREATRDQLRHRQLQGRRSVARTRRVRTAPARTSPTSTADPAPPAGKAAAASAPGGAS